MVGIFMKLGFIMAYNEENWIGYAIEQARKICDKVIISEGSQFVNFSNIPERSTDGTLDVISDKISQYPDFIEVQNSVRTHQNYRKNQCENFNLALSKANLDDYFIPLDADEYYSDSFLKYINNTTDEGKVDRLISYGHLYGFSFKWRIHFDNATRWKKDILFKVVPGCQFIPTHIPSGFGSNVVEYDKDVIFHYTWLKPTERLRTRFTTSNFHPGMLNWFNTTWNTIKLQDRLQKPSYKNGTFTLTRYEGEHPAVLNNHPWRKIEDIRKWK